MHGREYYIWKAKEQRGLSDETIAYFLENYSDFTLLPYYATWVKKGATKEEALQMLLQQYGVKGKIRDVVTGTELHPGEPELCQGNGEHPGFECCDNCSGYLACFPEWKAHLQEHDLIEE